VNDYKLDTKALKQYDIVDQIMYMVICDRIATEHNDKGLAAMPVDIRRGLSKPFN